VTGAIAVEFWGVRGSLPCPGPAYARYGGNTSCLLVRCGPHRLILDAGTGIVPLGRALLEEGVAAIDLFFSHTHLDHVLGLPFFGPARVPGTRLRLWAGHLLPAMRLADALDRLMAPPLFPVPVSSLAADLAFEDFRAGATLAPAPGLVVRTHPLAHPDNATAYRIEWQGRAVCYVTDVEHVPGRTDAALARFLAGADLLVYDSTYADAEFAQRIGWGHSTWEEALRLADAAGVARAVVFHHDPGRDDTAMDRIQAAAAARRPGTLVAMEGMRVEV